jgi:hypothetical protein
MKNLRNNLNSEVKKIVWSLTFLNLKTTVGTAEHIKCFPTGFFPLSAKLIHNYDDRRRVMLAWPLLRMRAGREQEAYWIGADEWNSVVGVWEWMFSAVVIKSSVFWDITPCSPFLPASYRVLTWLRFNPDDLGRHVSLQTNYTPLCPRRLKSWRFLNLFCLVIVQNVDHFVMHVDLCTCVSTCL